MRSRKLLPPTSGAMALLLLTAGLASASHSDSHFVVLSGSQGVDPDAEVCFTIDGAGRDETQLRLRLNFDGAVPHGRALLDESSTSHFNDANEEFVFWIDSSGVHRLRLDLDRRATMSWLSLSVPAGDLQQVNCGAYVPLEARGDVGRGFRKVNQFERRFDWTGSGDEDRDEDRYPATLLPAGTRLSLRLEQALTSRTAYAGQPVWATLADDVSVDGRLALREGTRVEGEVVEARDAGRFGRSLLRLRFQRIHVPGDRDLLIESRLRRVGPGSGGKQAGIIAGSALGGALLGKVLGGDDEDAVIGAVLGGGIAAGSIGARANESVVLPEGTILEIETEVRARLGQ